MRRILHALLAASLALTVAACTRSVQDEDLSDPAVKAHIQAQLHGMADLDMRYVTVDVNSGVVTVSGLVPTREQQRIIGQIVGRTRGVEQVLNNLVIQE